MRSNAGTGWTLALVATVITLASCVGNPPPVQQMGPDELWENGMQAYEDEDWERALLFLEQIAAEYRTHPRWEDARWQVAETFFADEDFITAANEYDRFARELSSSDRADDARFNVCMSYYELSPGVQLDQMYTEAALEHCRSLLAYFPSSEHAPRAREIVDEMEAKLARKVYIGGEYYFDRSRWDSAILYYERVVEEHGQSEVVPDALLRLLQIYTELEYTEDARATRERLLANYPDTEAAEEARSITVAGNS